MGPGIRVDPSRASEAEIVTASSGDGAEPEETKSAAAEEPAPA